MDHRNERWKNGTSIDGDLRLALLKDEHLSPIGMICLSAAILVNRFLPPHPPLDFVVGLLTGISIVLNITGMIRFRHSGTRKGQE